MNQTTPSISTETALELVADERCRAILTQLRESENRTVEFDALVTYIASENPPPERGSSPYTEPVLLDLYHNRLPKLDAAGIIEYDERSENVRYRPDERVEKLHRFVTTELE